MHKARDYQEQAVIQTFKAFDQFNSTLISSPTGTGKSTMAGHVASRFDGARYGIGNRVLLLAHTDPLVFQLYADFASWFGGQVAIEKGVLQADESPIWESDKSRYVVASVQTMMREYRRGKFDPTEFGLVVIDEAHHAVTDMYAGILDHFRGRKVLGMTGTTERADQISLGKTFESIAFHYEILDAINDGWLCRIRQHYIHVEGLDFGEIRSSGDDISAEDLGRVMHEESILHRIVRPAIERSEDRPTLVFAPTIGVAEALAAMFNRYDRNAASFVHSKMEKDDIDAAMKDFAAGDIQYLVNCAMLTEGWNCPQVSHILNTRPTRSKIFYRQMVGRGLRGGAKCPVPGKTDLLVSDLAGASMKHNLQSVADLLGGKYDDVVISEAKRRAIEAALANQDGATDMVAELIEAAKMKDELKSAQRAEIIAKAVKMRTVEIDPFDLLNVKERTPPSFWEGRGASEGQQKFLEANGVKHAKGLSYARARQLCETIAQRKRDGQCTLRQARLLASFGQRTNMTEEKAKEVIDRLIGAPGEDGKRRGPDFKKWTREDWRRWHEKKRRKRKAVEQQLKDEGKID